MCCAFLSLVLLGPRIVGAFWWIFQPARWQLVFDNWGGLWWIWPMLGIVFLPWTTLMYVIVAPGGMIGWDSAIPGAFAEATRGREHFWAEIFTKKSALYLWDRELLGWDWLWVGLMVVADVTSYGGGLGRKQIPGYEGY